MEYIIKNIKSVLEFYQALGFDTLLIPMDMEKRGYGDSGRKSPRVTPSPCPRVTMPKEAVLKALKEEIGDCKKCKLSTGRKNIVFGEGSPAAKLMFIGEGPGREEDIQARPLLGRQVCSLQGL